MKYFRIHGSGEPQDQSIVNIQRDPNYPPKFMDVDAGRIYWGRGESLDEVLKKIPQAFPIRHYDEITEQQYENAWRKNSRGKDMGLAK